MNRETKFRGRMIGSTQWVYGSLVVTKRNSYIVPVYDEVTTAVQFFAVDPATVGQLRHINQHGEYYDGDVYHHAGYGNETVSDLCELQMALMTGHDDDIGIIYGNIHENPELL